MELGQGEYVVVPRTTGCNVSKPDPSKRDPVPRLLDSTGCLVPLAQLILKDLFRRLDKLTLDNSLSYQELNEFYKRV